MRAIEKQAYWSGKLRRIENKANARADGSSNYDCPRMQEWRSAVTSRLDRHTFTTPVQLLRDAAMRKHVCNIEYQLLLWPTTIFNPAWSAEGLAKCMLCCRCRDEAGERARTDQVHITMSLPLQSTVNAAHMSEWAGRVHHSVCCPMLGSATLTPAFLMRLMWLVHVK